MTPETATLLTLLVYKALLLGIGWWATTRTKSAADFFLGGRGLGAWVAAISAAASSSSAWTLLSVSGYAYLHGLAALWLFPGCVGGFALNWYAVAPRLRRTSGEALTLNEYLAGPPGGAGRTAFLRTSAAITLFCLFAYVAAQFQAAGQSLAQTFDADLATMVVVGAAIVVGYTLLGGFWAASVTDTVQGLLMAGVAIGLPLTALVTVGGPSALAGGIAELGSRTGGLYTDLGRGFGFPLAVGFALGLLGIGLGYPGQPHVVNRFMALRGERELIHGRRISMAWAIAVYSGMLLLGWCGRLLIELPSGAHEKIFLETAHELFPPVLSAILTAAVLSAIMSTADSQLLVAASTLVRDLGLGARSPASLVRTSRIVVCVLGAGATLAALETDQTIFARVLFAFSALGNAFGPLLLVTLWKGPVPPRRGLAALLTGFVLSVAAYQLAKVPGLLTGTAIEERVLPFLAAGLVALWPARRTQPPQA